MAPVKAQLKMLLRWPVDYMAFVVAPLDPAFAASRDAASFVVI